MNLARAITSLCPDAQFSIEDEDYTKIRWIVEPPTIPTLQALIEEDTRLNKIDFDSQYKSKRRQEYPSIGDQLDALFHAGAFPQEMTELIRSVKLKYPKPE